MKRLTAPLSCLLFSWTIASAANATQNLWQALSRSFTLPNEANTPYVRQQIQWLQRHPGYLNAFAKRSSPYIYYVLEEVKRRRLPGEVALIPMVESNYNPFTYSRVGAAGLWQLMPETGSGLGVTQNRWYDGRRAVTSSTDAALNYVTYLNHFFGGRWLLTFAAYDSGEGTVQHAYQRTLGNQNFWALPLPRETRNYVPRILALAAVIKHPRRYGFRLPAYPYTPYFSQVTVDKPLNLHEAASLAGISYRALLQLNPAHNQWTTAPGQPASLLLPLSHTAEFKLNYDVFRAQKYRHHRVSSGESLSQIAAQYHSSVNEILKLNSLKTSTIHPKQVLTLPRHSGTNHAYRIDKQRQATIERISMRGPKLITHYVNAHDTLASIGRLYHVHTAEIMFWNQLKSSKLTKNQKLTLWLPQHHSWHSADTESMYRIKKNDTLSTIAVEHGISIARLIALNPLLKDVNTIQTDHLLRLPA